MRTSPAFVDENGLQYKKEDHCDCCPYGYHIDLDFVRYCESLANAKPSEEQLLRRCRRRSRKSMEFMLGLESLFEHWEHAGRVTSLPEVPIEIEPESPRLATTNISLNSSDPATPVYYSCNGESPVTTTSYPSPTTGVYVESTLSAPEETSAFLHDALDEVVSDFERTLERASGRRKQKRTCHSWDEYSDVIDSCVAGHKSRSPKQKHAEPEKEQMEKVPPPPPPRRMKYQDDAATKKPSGLAPDALSEAYTLYSIRQQMAISLNRMKELEEQVRSIPELKSELNQLRDENRHLQQELQNKEVELLKLKDRSSVSPVPPTNSFSSPRLSPPVTFAPQRVSPIALESLGSRLRSGSVSSNEHNRSSHQVLKRDVAVMCTSHTKDASIGTTPILMRSIGTNSDILENRYTKQEFNENMQISIYEYEEKNRADLAKTFISVGTQMYTPTRRELHDTASQTILETPVLKSSIGITARPRLHDAIILCKPDIRTIGSSDHRITDTLCDICDRPKRTVACGPDSQEQTAKPISLKLLDTINLVENENPIIKKRNAGTQSECTTHSIGAQTSFPVSSIGIQNAPTMQSEYSQCNVDTISRQTDTRGLIQLRTTQVNTDILPEPKKPLSCDSSCNTEHKKTKHCETNTPLPPRTKHSSSNTEHPRTKDIGCGDIVKPHISIACADNYCDSCKDAIKHLAKDFSKTQAALQTGKDISKIPRPKNLPSPSPVRKKFLRQNTYTITPSPSPSPSAEKKSFISLLDERAAVASSSLDPVNPSEHTTQSNEKDESNEMKQKQIIEEIADQSSKIREFCHEEGIPDFGRNLIVKEETKVRISWSRENSPTPSTSTTSTVRTVVERENSMDTNKDPMDPVEAETPCEEKKIITNKIAPSQRGQREVQAMIVNQIVSQEVTPREKIYPSKEMQAALKVINDSLQKFSSKSTDHTSATAVVQLEWFHISSTDKANPLVVEDYLDCFEDFSSALLKFVVNLTDTNGNTAMHYAVSHGNFDVVSILLDSKVCNVNQMNNAGYTSVMLVSLAKLKSMAHRTVVQRLFQMADVNIRAKKHCQTALMLAVSHGNLDMVEMLLNAGADINIQDEDGSTALMCAAEHGRVDIVKHLLSQADCDSLIQDVDGSTAFKIAWQAGHRDIGLLLYVHEQMLRSKMPSKPEQRTASQSPRHHKRQPSQ